VYDTLLIHPTLAEENWQDVIDSLEQRLAAPLLSVIPFSATDNDIPHIKMRHFLF